MRRSAAVFVLAWAFLLAGLVLAGEPAQPAPSPNPDPAGLPVGEGPAAPTGGAGCAAVAGVVLAAAHGLGSLHLRVNQIVSAMALNIFALGATGSRSRSPSSRSSSSSSTASCSG